MEKAKKKKNTITVQTKRNLLKVSLVQCSLWREAVRETQQRSALRRTGRSVLPGDKPPTGPAPAENKIILKITHTRALSLETILPDSVKPNKLDQARDGVTLNQAYIVLLVLVALHDGNDAVVYEEGQSENAGQLGEEQSELWNNSKRGGDSVVSSFFVKIMEGRNTATKLHKNNRLLIISSTSVSRLKKNVIFKCWRGSSSQAHHVCCLFIFAPCH